MSKVLFVLARYVYGLSAAIYMFTIGWLVSGRARGQIRSIAEYFGFRADEFRLPGVDLREIVASDCAVVLTELAEGDGNVTLCELSVIGAIAAQFAPRTIFEIGTFDGRTTLNMAINALPDAIIYTLDLPREQIDSTKLHVTTGDRAFIDKPRSGARFAGTEAAGKITQLYGDSAAFDFGPFFGTIDLVFVDGSHAYDYVCNDTETALKLLRNGHGVILWHDYTAWVDVTKALTELNQRNPVLKNMQNIKGTTLVYLQM